MIQLCRYLLQGGNQCQQAAINGENYCRHHLVVRRTVAASTPKQNPYRIEKPLPLVFPEDRAALQINIFVVMQAFNEGQIGPKSANIFTRLLHECAVNLKQGPLYDTDHENAVRSVVVTPEGEEIAPAREVPEDCEEAGGSETASSETAGDEAVNEVSARSVAVHRASNDSLCGTPSEDFASTTVPTSQNRDVGHPQVGEQGDAGHPQVGEQGDVGHPQVGEQGDVGHPQVGERGDVGHPQVGERDNAGHPQIGEQGDVGHPSVTVPNTGNSSLGATPSETFACNDPCYVETLRQRRAQYRKLATYELAAGIDPRPWEDFIPGKSRVRKPKVMASGSTASEAVI